MTAHSHFVLITDIDGELSASLHDSQDEAEDVLRDVWGTYGSLGSGLDGKTGDELVSIIETTHPHVRIEIEECLA